MKNKLILSGLAFCMATSLNATPLLSHEEEPHYSQLRKEILNFFNNDDLFTVPYHKYKILFSSTYPKMNAFENKGSYVFKFELPGIDKKDIKVTINDQNILTITGTKKELTKEEKEGIIKQEQFYGTFTRNVSLPDDIDSDKIDLKYSNGILKITVPKDMKKVKNKVKILSID